AKVAIQTLFSFSSPSRPLFIQISSSAFSIHSLRRFSCRALPLFPCSPLFSGSLRRFGAQLSCPAGLGSVVGASGFGFGVYP
ncbi:MAG: hypothetical protein WDA72_12860, partial [Desulfomonilia bacterium]